MGAWLSWLERTVHIRKVVGSSPSAPILYLTLYLPLCLYESRGFPFYYVKRTGESLRAHSLFNFLLFVILTSKARKDLG